MTEDVVEALLAHTTIRPITELKPGETVFPWGKVSHIDLVEMDMMLVHFEGVKEPKVYNRKQRMEWLPIKHLYIVHEVKP